MVIQEVMDCVDLLDQMVLKVYLVMLAKVVSTQKALKERAVSLVSTVIR